MRVKLSLTWRVAYARPEVEAAGTVEMEDGAVRATYRLYRAHHVLERSRRQSRNSDAMAAGAGAVGGADGAGGVGAVGCAEGAGGAGRAGGGERAGGGSRGAIPIDPFRRGFDAFLVPKVGWCRLTPG